MAIYGGKSNTERIDLDKPLQKLTCRILLI